MTGEDVQQRPALPSLRWFLNSPTAGITNNTTALPCSTVLLLPISLTATGVGTYSWPGGLGTAAGGSCIAPNTYTVTVTGANSLYRYRYDCYHAEHHRSYSRYYHRNTGTTVLNCTTTAISLTALQVLERTAGRVDWVPNAAVSTTSPNTATAVWSDWR